MIQTLRNAWKVPELKSKILFTIFALLIFRFGSAIPVPFINTEGLTNYINSMSGTIFGLLGTMNGTAFSIAAVFALGVQPYINSSIIIQLLTVAIPALERLQKEGGEEGRKKIAAITRYVTVAIALLQGFGYYTIIRTNQLLNLGTMNGIWGGIVIVATFAAGSAFVMWLGEQITDKGIGNGISIILFAGILSRMPTMITELYTGVSNWAHHVDTSDFTEQQLKNFFVLPPWGLVLIIAGMLAMILFVVWIQNAERRIPVQYAKRVVGRKMYGGQSTTIPLKVNMSGVMPIIFAQTIASIPATIAAFVPSLADSTFMRLFDTTSVVYCVVYALLIVGFSYFYATIQFNPVEVSNNLKKQGGFIPGYRAGRPTADFLRKILNRITMFGAIYLAIVAILPIVTGAIFNISALAIGGTSVLIVVSVALDTQKSLEATMMMKQYKGFLD